MTLDDWQAVPTSGEVPDVDVVVAEPHPRARPWGMGTLLVVDDCVLSAQAARRSVALGQAGGAVYAYEDPSTFLLAVAAVGQGLSTVSSAIRDSTSSLPVLDDRTLEVLMLARSGLTNEAIAHRCAISVATVKRELRRMFDSFGVSSRAELVLATAGRRRSGRSTD